MNLYRDGRINCGVNVDNLIQQWPMKVNINKYLLFPIPNTIKLF